LYYKAIFVSKFVRPLQDEKDINCGNIYKIDINNPTTPKSSTLICLVIYITIKKLTPLERAEKIR